MALQTDPRTFDVPSGFSTASRLEIVRDHPVGVHLRCLCRFEDGELFAYAERGHDFVRASDRELWAVERDDTLVSVRSGALLAQRRGRVYFATGTELPLYYKRAI